MNMGARVPTTATVEANSSIAVPYADRTEPDNSLRF